MAVCAQCFAAHELAVHMDGLGNHICMHDMPRHTLAASAYRRSQSPRVERAKLHDMPRHISAASAYQRSQSPRVERAKLHDASAHLSSLRIPTQSVTMCGACKPMQSPLVECTAA
eukprot:1160136-Pelagomonas_calceolata.AAC.5